MGHFAESTQPYLGHPVVAGHPIEAENFDNGGSGVGYYVPSASQLGIYRNTEVGVQPNGSNGFNVGHTTAGQWLAYTIHAPITGDYVFSATVACPNPGARFHISFDGTNRTGALEVPRTSNWSDWNTVTSHSFNLSAGDHVMRLHIDSNANGLPASGNFDTLFVTPVRPNVRLSWTKRPDAPAARFEGVGRVVHGKLYTFGGYTCVDPVGATNSASIYDPATGRWTDLGAAPIPETHCGVTVDEAKGIIYFVGGRHGLYPGVATSEAWQYNVDINAWSQLPALPEALSAGSADLVNGDLHYMGGNIGTDRSTDYPLHYVLTPGATTWRKATPMPIARDHFATIVIGQKIYIFGGEIGHDSFHRQLTDTSVYDCATDSWTTLAAMPIAKSHAESSTFLLNGRVIIAGGQVDNYLATASITEYDPAADSWAMLPSLPQPLEGVVVQPLGDSLFVTGGYIGRNGVASFASYSSNTFTGTPNASAFLAPHVALPLGAGLLMMLGTVLALVARRTRKVGARDRSPLHAGAVLG